MSETLGLKSAIGVSIGVYRDIYYIDMFYRDIYGLGFPKSRGNFLQVPTIRSIVFWGL